MTEQFETRTIELSNETELRFSTGDRPKVSGYAVVFNKRAKLSERLKGPFTEEIAPGAFNLNRPIMALWNHNRDLPIGITGKNLKLYEDNIGIRFEIDPLPDTAIGRDAAKNIEMGMASKMSFGFRINSGGEDWDYGTSGIPHRRVTSGELFEVSPVTMLAAYQDTSVSLRSMQDFCQQVEGDEIDARKRRMKFKRRIQELAR